MFLPTPTLTTARVRARPFADSDVDDLYALHSDAHALRYWDSPPWTGRDRATAFVERCRSLAEDGTGARWAVDRQDDSRFLGWCSLTRFDPDHRSAALGCCYRPEAWGRGYATEVVRAVLDWAYDALDLNRVQAETDTRNIGSARVLEKAGFRPRGHAARGLRGRRRGLGLVGVRAARPGPVGGGGRGPAPGSRTGRRCACVTCTAH